MTGRTAPGILQTSIIEQRPCLLLWRQSIPRIVEGIYLFETTTFSSSRPFQVNDPFAHALPIAACRQVPGGSSFIKRFVKLSVSLVQDLQDILKAQRPSSIFDLHDVHGVLGRSLQMRRDQLRQLLIGQSMELARQDHRPLLVLALFLRTRTRVFFNANICQLTSAASFPSSHLSMRFLEGCAEVVCFVVRLVSFCRQRRGSQHAEMKVKETAPLSVSQIPSCTGRSPVNSGTDPVAHQSQRTQVCAIGLSFIVLPTLAMQALFAEE